jgi:hypothetical protein
MDVVERSPKGTAAQGAKILQTASFSASDSGALFQAWSNEPMTLEQNWTAELKK